MGHARDLRGGQIVAEAEDEQELVGGPELHRASVEQRYELASPHLLFRVRHRVGVAVMQMIDVDILSNEIRQPAPDCAAVPRGVVAASWAAVALPVFIETETLGNHYQPRGQLAPPLSGPEPEAMAVVGAQMFQNERITIHDGVLRTAGDAGDVEQQTAVGSDEARPRRIPTGGIRGLEQLGQFGRHVVFHVRESMCFGPGVQSRLPGQVFVRRSVAA